MLLGKCSASGTEVKIDGEELLIMKESDVMGVVEGIVVGGHSGERPKKKQSREEETQGKQEQGRADGFAVCFNRTAGEAQPKRFKKTPVTSRPFGWPSLARMGHSGRLGHGHDERSTSRRMP